MGSAGLALTGTVLVALIGALSGSAWLNRRNLARLTAAQAEREETSAVEVTDRIARQWLEELRTEVLFLRGEIAGQERELRIERRARRAAAAYIERLLDYINGHIQGATAPPPIPSELTDYLGV